MVQSTRDHVEYPHGEARRTYQPNRFPLWVPRLSDRLERSPERGPEGAAAESERPPSGRQTVHPGQSVQERIAPYRTDPSIPACGPALETANCAARLR